MISQRFYPSTRLALCSKSMLAIVLLFVIAGIAYYLYSTRIPEKHKKKHDDGDQDASPEPPSQTKAAKHHKKAKPAAPKPVVKANKAGPKYVSTLAGEHPLLLKELKGHLAQATCVAWSADQSFVATASEDCSIRVIHLDTLNDANPKIFRLAQDYDYVNALAFSDNSKRLAAVTANGRRCLFYSIPTPAEIKKGAKPAIVKEFDTKHSQPVLEVLLLDVEKWMVIVTVGSGEDTIINFWNLKGELLSHVDTGHIRNNAVCASPDNRFVAVGCYMPEVSIFEVCRNKTGEFTKATKAMTLSGHKGQVMGVSISSDSTHACTLATDGTFRIWDITVRYNLDEDPRCIGRYTIDASHKGAASGISFGPGAHSQIVVAIGDSLVFYCAKTGAELSVIEGASGGGGFTRVTAPSDLRMLATIAPNDRHVCLWNYPPTVVL